VLSPGTSTLVVDRLPGHAAYPRQSGSARLFTLLPGQIGRYRANFRFAGTTCGCNPSRYYEDWLRLIANGEIPTDGFVTGAPDHDIDHRVHLYGDPDGHTTGNPPPATFASPRTTHHDRGGWLQRITAYALSVESRAGMTTRHRVPRRSSCWSVGDLAGPA
jgi:hypothetical protein